MVLRTYKLGLWVALLSFSMACAQGDLESISERTPFNAGATTQPPVENPDPILLPGLGGLQVKSFSLLKSSINSCVGDRVDIVKPDMLFNDASAQGESIGNQIRFLLAKDHPAGASILDLKQDFLVDPIYSGDRLSASANSFTVNYLTSLEIIANTVAHNCEPEFANCQCSTPALAEAMMERCLPGLDPSSEAFEAAVDTLYDVCKEATTASGVAGFRKAIASLLSSMAFASSR